LATARLSPVSMLSSTVDCPRTTSPSTGTASPARTTKRSPGFTSASATSTIAPSRSRRARLGCSFTSPSSAADVPARARVSSSLPSSTSVITAADASKYTCSGSASTVTTAESPYAIVVPSATSTSMFAPPPRSACHAPT
jgi:hypothetical protein